MATGAPVGFHPGLKSSDMTGLKYPFGLMYIMLLQVFFKLGAKMTLLKLNRIIF